MSTRPIIYGEYPYYRADPDRWGPNLAALADAGIDVVTCYLPWRFHETAPRRYDFGGGREPQRDVGRLIALAQSAGLGVLLKPGPFIHAEVQLGGLPDRVSPTVDPTYTAVLDALGRPVTAQGRALPSLSCRRFRAEVRHWLGAVDRQVLAHTLAPHGPVVAVQIGNEGIYSDANRPATAHDFAAPVLASFAERLRTGGSGLAAAVHDVHPADWPPALRQAWAWYGGELLHEQYLDLAADLSPQVRRVATVNLPLPALDGPAGGAAAWLLRTARLGETGLREGYTAWVGNPARSRAAFTSHWFGVRTRRSSNVEDNWGFTWTDPTFARPGNALFQSLLALALGSRSCSVYTACATGHWGPLIDLDPAGVRADGLDPVDYAPPYCPGAPLREDGTAGANLHALHALRDLVRAPHPGQAGARFAADAVLLVPEALARAEAWPDDTDPAAPALRTVAGLAVDLMERHQFQIDVVTETNAPDAGAGLPWLVPVGPAGPDPRLAALIHAHRATGQPVVLLGGPQRAGDPVVAPDAPDRTPLLRLLPPPRHGHPDSDPAVVFVHVDAAGQPLTAFVFNLGPRPATVRRTLHGCPVTVEVPPHGAVCLRRAGTGFTPVAVGAGCTPVEVGTDLDPPAPTTASAPTIASGPTSMEETA